MAPPTASLERSGFGEGSLVLGECVQGCLEGGRHFLITSPIGLFTWARFSADPAADRVTVDPPGLSKSLSAVERYLAAEGLPTGGRLRVFTPLASAHGFGTSTADIIASVRAAAAYWGRRVEPEALAALAVGIEPSDGSMYRGCVAFAQRAGVLLERLGELPRFEAVVGLVGEKIDTVEFDRIRESFRYSRGAIEELARSWAMVREANRTGDVSLLAGAATISARINQQFVPKPFFAEMLELVEHGCADGLMVAHSGSMLALILDPGHQRHLERRTEAQRFLASLGRFPRFHLASDQRFLKGFSAGEPSPFEDAVGEAGRELAGPRDAGSGSGLERRR